MKVRSKLRLYGRLRRTGYAEFERKERIDCSHCLLAYLTNAQNYRTKHPLLRNPRCVDLDVE
jgi:hypothetical protein